MLNNIKYSKKKITTSKAYDDFKKATKLADKAEQKYSANTDSDKALKEWGDQLAARRAAKKQFTREDKRQYKIDKRELKRKNIK